jgi:hypothetical protein
MNYCRESAKMGVPARHREPARSGEAGGPPGNRRVLVSRRTLRNYKVENVGRPFSAEGNTMFTAFQ